VSPGGYVVVDDYGNIPQCRQAIDDYREGNGITAPLNRIDWAGVWWQVDGAPAGRPGREEAREITIEDAAVEDARA
jgi:hypothetical protein